MCLQYFDTTKPVTLQVDASKVGLGAILIKNDSQGRGKPVAFASKSLTPAEIIYAKIECKMLAVVFGCIKFHHYLYDRKFICEGDHKPLDNIHLKQLSDAQSRLQRLLLKIQPYDFSNKYIPGPKIPMADALSRVSPHEKVEMSPSMSLHQLCLEYRSKQSRRQCKSTPHSQPLMQQMIKGWPKEGHKNFQMS